MVLLLKPPQVYLTLHPVCSKYNFRTHYSNGNQAGYIFSLIVINQNLFPTLLKLLVLHRCSSFWNKVFCWASPTTPLRPGCQSVVPGLGTWVDTPCRHWGSPQSFLLWHTGPAWPAFPGPRRGWWGGPMAWWDLQQGGHRGTREGRVTLSRGAQPEAPEIQAATRTCSSREMEALTCWRYFETAPGKCETCQPRREMSKVVVQGICVTNL